MFCYVGDINRLNCPIWSSEVLKVKNRANINTLKQNCFFHTWELLTNYLDLTCSSVTIKFSFFAFGQKAAKSKSIKLFGHKNVMVRDWTLVFKFLSNQIQWPLKDFIYFVLGYKCTCLYRISFTIKGILTEEIVLCWVNTLLIKKRVKKFKGIIEAKISKG